MDLSNRKIIGSAVAKNKSAEIVRKAFFSMQSDLRRIQLFHTDRGAAFKNEVIDKICTEDELQQVIDNILKAFNIDRSLSSKESPIDNAVAESMYSVIKTKFAFKREFANIEELEIEWFDYINWYNNVRVLGSLGYKTPAEFC